MFWAIKVLNSLELGTSKTTSSTDVDHLNVLLPPPSEVHQEVMIWPFSDSSKIMELPKDIPLNFNMQIDPLSE